MKCLFATVSQGLLHVLPIWNGIDGDGVESHDICSMIELLMGDRLDEEFAAQEDKLLIYHKKSPREELDLGFNFTLAVEGVESNTNV